MKGGGWQGGRDGGGDPPPCASESQTCSNNGAISSAAICSFAVAGRQTELGQKPAAPSSFSSSFARP